MSCPIIEICTADNIWQVRAEVNYPDGGVQVIEFKHDGEWRDPDDLGLSREAVDAYTLEVSEEFGRLYGVGSRSY